MRFAEYENFYREWDSLSVCATLKSGTAKEKSMEVKQSKAKQNKQRRKVMSSISEQSRKKGTSLAKDLNSKNLGVGLHVHCIDSRGKDMEQNGESTRLA